MSRWILFTGLLVFASAIGASQVKPGGNNRERLNNLFQRAWEFTLQENPLLATSFGDLRYNDRLPSESLADQHRRAHVMRNFLEELNTLSDEGLTPADRMNREIFSRWLSDALSKYEFRDYLMPITNREGFHVFFPELPDQVPLRTTRHYEDYIRRLQGFKTYVKQHIELLREAVRDGYTLPGIVMENFKDSIRPHIIDNPEESLLFKPFKEFPATVPSSNRARLIELGRKAIRESVVPGYQEFLAFMEQEYLPKTRKSTSISDIPRGDEYYRFLVRHYTTLDFSPEQVHQIGLEEVSRVHHEMERVTRDIGFQGTFQDFIHDLRTNPRFYAKTAEELLSRVSYILKRMDGELPRLFKTLPRLPYGIREIPSYIAPKTTTAYYSPGAMDGSRAGYYYVNTYDLPSRPLYEIEALSFHEAVPGHHLQIALQQEMKDVPDFRRVAEFTVMVEGWALYAESLGLETGFYKDPYSNFGRLSFSMWRALRLVVDTGLHAMGWSRQQAIDYMAKNSALTLPNITNEVDRYIAWPGQALAYKIGELKIRELRELAEKELGEHFDIREFHDVVLKNGAIPLNILEKNVKTWINETGNRGTL